MSITSSSSNGNGIGNGGGENEAESPVANGGSGGNIGANGGKSLSPFVVSKWKRRSCWVDTLTFAYNLEQDRAGHLPLIWVTRAGTSNDARQKLLLLPCVAKETILLLFLPANVYDPTGNNSSGSSTTNEANGISTRADFIGVSELPDTVMLTAVREMHKLERVLTAQQSQLSRDEASGHVTGYRYMFRNLVTGIAAASPPNKVSKMSKESLSVVRGIREEFCSASSIDSKDIPSTGGTDVEVFIRTSNESWIILRRFGPRELIVVLEKAGETLLEAAAAVKMFAARFFRGMEIKE